MIATRPLRVAGYVGPGQQNMPIGTMLMPAMPHERFEHSRICTQCVLESGEYRYPREGREDVKSLLDIGLNLGAFTLWPVKCWWPGQIERVIGYEPNEEAFELAAENLRGLPVRDLELYCEAVTTDPAPLFTPLDTGGRDNWGGGRTHGVVEGARVKAKHPRELPACDVVKVDGEGIEAEFFAHYPHGASVKIAMFEWHDERHRELIENTCRGWGLAALRIENGDGQGQQIWGRP